MEINKTEVSPNFLDHLAKHQATMIQEGEVKAEFNRVLTWKEILIAELAGFTHEVVTGPQGVKIYRSQIYQAIN